jgi:hypothetical protein
MGVREWGHLAWLVALLGHTLKGNTQSRRDARDPDEWASYADRVGALQFTVPGSGPLSWFHNGLPSGIVDLLGNLPHFLATDGAAPASLLVVREAVLSDPDGITDEDTDFYISNPRHGYDSWFSFENWPESNGLIRIDNELVSYGTLTIDENDASIAHLTNCTRGRYGTSAASHAEDAAMQLERWHTVAPGSYAAKLAAGIDDQVGQLGLDWNAFSHGARDANPTIGDVLCLENEDVLVTGINGTDLAVTRGHNGTTPAAHLAGAFVVKYPTTMTRAQQGYVSGFATGAVRTHVDLEPLYLPAACQAAEPAGIQPYVQFSLKDAAAWYVLRGAPNQRNAAESQLSLQVLSGASVPNGNQWRCVRYVS